MSDLQTLIERPREFGDARDWAQFHTQKTLAAALSVEAAELLELTQWKTPLELERVSDDQELKSSFGSEIADVFIYHLLICEKLNIGPVAEAKKKVLENEKR